MIFKIIAFLAAAIPVFLFVRSVFFRRTTRVNEGLKEFKKQANLAVSIFLRRGRRRRQADLDVVVATLSCRAPRTRGRLNRAGS
jgi:hypothetical protein